MSAFEKIPAPARRAAFDVLCRIELAGAYSDVALRSGTVNRLDSRDRNLVTEIVYGTLRRRAQLDHLLADASSRPWEDVDVPVRVALRMALYQMWRMDRVPDHAAVGEAVSLVRREVSQGAGAFTNAILRTLSRNRPWELPDFEANLPLHIRASLPGWLWGRWEARYGPREAMRFACSLNDPPPCVTALGDASTQPMDEASRLMPRLLELPTGAAVWDACAAPGGKSMILREIVGQAGLVVASDASVRRTRLMAARLVALGGKIYTLAADARYPPPFRRYFDAVLVDAPCSGLGTLRRNPEIKWRLAENRLEEHHGKQAEILSAASEAVGPGGILLYSTCSTEPEENEAVVEEFLCRHSEFSLSAPAVPEEAAAGLDKRGFFRTFPSVRAWDGFFAARMIRSTAGPPRRTDRTA